MSLSAKYIAPLAFSFAAISGAATANDNSADATVENHTPIFTCDAPDLSHLDLADWADEMMPAMVFVKTSKAPTPEQLMQFGEQEAPEFLPNAMGSGFFINNEGYILTNHHVIENTDHVDVVLYDPTKVKHEGQTVPVTVVGSDSVLDLALLKADLDYETPCVRPADSDIVRRGESARAIGNPLGQVFSLTTGIISHPNTQTGRSSAIYGYIQTDAAINQGNSGGGLFNEAGEFIGINTLILSRGGGSDGLGFAIQSNDIVDIAKILGEFGEVRRGGAGIQIQPVNDIMAERNGIQKGVGVLVGGVAPDRPAAMAGIQPGDIILNIAGVEMNTTTEVIKTISSYLPGDDIPFDILRDGEALTLTITLTDRENAISAFNPAPAESEQENEQTPEQAPQEQQQQPAPAPE